MKMRLAWLADAEDADSYSARECRVLLRAIARQHDWVPMWFALGSSEPPHFWNGIRVFPLPPAGNDGECFLETLIHQQRPHMILSNLPWAKLPVGCKKLTENGTRWLHRVAPEDTNTNLAGAPAPSFMLVADGNCRSNGSEPVRLPHLFGLNPAISGGEEPSAVLETLKKIIAAAAPMSLGAARYPTHLIMRQQLFCNTSLAHAMFELTNALVQIGIPTVAQDEHALFSKAFVHREEERFRIGAPDKYERVKKSIGRDYDPENAITIHFSMLRGGAKYTRHGVFASLGPREVLYTTGNHAVSGASARELAENFEMILAPSGHVLRPYREAGLSRHQGAVIPHGVDPVIFRPDSPPYQYGSEKSFKFLQTSFPWIYEKGFDLTIKAFGQAFTAGDDVALILRIPVIQDKEERERTFGRLKALVGEECQKPGAPEIRLIEMDVGLNRRGGIYTGANCYVHPLRAEGFGMTILEAMACGLPVIATAWSGPADFLSRRYAYTLRHSNPIPERTKDGTVLRYHVEPDLEHLIHLMRYVYEHQDKARMLGQIASEVAKQDWTWIKAAEKLAATFFLQPAQDSNRVPSFDL